MVWRFAQGGLLAGSQGVMSQIDVYQTYVLVANSDESVSSHS